MKKMKIILMVLLLMVSVLMLVPEARAEEPNPGLAYGFSWFGDKYVQVNDINETWVDSPIQTNYWTEGAMAFCWLYDVQPGRRVQAVEFYILSNGGNVLQLDWLADMVIEARIFLWNFTATDWDEVWYTSNYESMMWTIHNLSLSSEYNNGTVMLRWEFERTFTSRGGQWIPALYVDYIAMTEVTIETETEPTEGEPATIIPEQSIVDEIDDNTVPSIVVVLERLAVVLFGLCLLSLRRR